MFGSLPNLRTCVLADVLAGPNGQNGFAPLDLVKPKVFFDRDAAITLPQRTRRVRSEKESRSGHMSRVAYSSPDLFNPLGPPPATTAFRADHTLWYPAHLCSLPKPSDCDLVLSSIRRLSCLGVDRLPKYGSPLTWSANCQRHRLFRPISRNQLVSLPRLAWLDGCSIRHFRCYRRSGGGSHGSPSQWTAPLGCR